MCSILTHPAVPIALSFLLPEKALSPKLVIVGVLCWIVPDLDVIAFRFGVGYGHMFGHRGFTHSIFFAAIFALALTCKLFRSTEAGNWVIFGFLFLSTLSHTLLDMLTNGGLGVALLAPFSGDRFFFPYRPIQVSPIGIGNFVSQRGVDVIVSELKWVWLPTSLFSAAAFAVRKLLP